MNICKKITIIGMGLLGGSIGKALIAKKLAGEVVGVVRRREAVEEVRIFGAADRATLDIAEGVSGAGMVILGVPIEQMEDISKSVVRAISKDTIVTDVGSVKAPVVKRLEKIFAGNGLFVGSHPMAGKEKSGIAFSDEDLFKDAITIVTRTPATSAPALDTVRSLWEKLGSKVVELSLEDHDKAVAAISHLPHVIAVSLMNSVASAKKGDFDPFKCVGPSFRDMTRIVASPSEMWAGILLENRKEVLSALDGFIAHMREFSGLLKKRDRAALEAIFSKAKKAKEAHVNGKNS